MKTKKNAGFSLVELIVVIAIMAVLVGVLAPAYLKYVEKSRKSTDVSAVADIMDAATTVAGDAEYDVPALAEFEMVGDSAGKITLELGGTTFEKSDDALKGWKDVASSTNGYQCKSKEFKAASSQTVNGIVQNNGSVVWKNVDKTASTKIFDAMCAYSSSLSGKFEN